MGGTASKERDDQAELSKAETLMEGFFQKPTRELFDKILLNDMLIFKNSSMPYTLFKLKVRSLWNLEPPLNSVEKQYLIDKELYLLGDDSQLTPEDLDCLWMLFHASGERVYASRIKQIFDGKELDTPIKQIAMWSYFSHVTKGYLED